MQAAPTRSTDDENSGLIDRIRCDHLTINTEWLTGKNLINRSDRFFGIAIMIADIQAQGRNAGNDNGRGPAAFEHFFVKQHQQYRRTDHEARQRQQKTPPPMRQLMAMTPPVAAQTEQRNSKVRNTEIEYNTISKVTLP